MRILHVIDSLDRAAGGPPYVATRLAAAQARLGHDVDLAYYDASQGDDSAGDEAIPGADQIRHRPLSLEGRVERWTAHAAGRALRRLIRNNDVVHLHGMWRPLLWTAATIARNFGVPYVITPHGMLDPWCLRQRSWKKRAALAFGWHRLLDGAAFLHVLNADEGRLLEPLGLACPVEVLPNGVFLDELAPSSDEDFFRTEFGFPGERTVLFLGRLHYKKGLDYLAAAFEILHRWVPDAHLVVAGPEEGAGRDFERQIAQLGLERHVHLPGPFYGRAKRAAMHSASCFCLPSRQEGFSIAVLEAMACRSPVVISEACHFPEVAENGAGMVVPLDPPAIADALRELLCNRDANRRMGEAGFELVRYRYTWPNIALQCLGSYDGYLLNACS